MSKEYMEVPREKYIEVPPDVNTVTLALCKEKGNEGGQLTLRALLPHVVGQVELVVEDAYNVDSFGHSEDRDLYRLAADSGTHLLEKIERSRVIDGDEMLELTPTVSFVPSQPTMLNGTFATLTGTGRIELWVRPLMPDGED